MWAEACLLVVWGETLLAWVRRGSCGPGVCVCVPVSRAVSVSVESPLALISGSHNWTELGSLDQTRPT